MASYLEKLVVGRFGFQLLAVGDGLLKLGGLDDHDCGGCSSSLEYCDFDVFDFLHLNDEAESSEVGDCRIDTVMMR